MRHHHKLRRQLQSANLSPADIEKLGPFLDMVSESYSDFDTDMENAESILEESSKELFLRNVQLKNNVEEVQAN